jgi:hypothetical protein
MEMGSWDKPFLLRARGPGHKYCDGPLHVYVLFDVGKM